MPNCECAITVVLPALQTHTANCKSMWKAVGTRIWWIFIIWIWFGSDSTCELSNQKQRRVERKYLKYTFWDVWIRKKGKHNAALIRTNKRRRSETERAGRSPCDLVKRNQFHFVRSNRAFYSPPVWLFHSFYLCYGSSDARWMCKGQARPVCTCARIENIDSIINRRRYRFALSSTSVSSAP